MLPEFNLPINGLDFLPDFVPIIIFFLILFISAFSSLTYNWKRSIFIASWLFSSYALTVLITLLAPNILVDIVKPLVQSFLTGNEMISVEVTNRQIQDLYFLFIPILYFILFLLILLILTPVLFILMQVFSKWINPKKQESYIKIEQGRYQRITKKNKTLGGGTRIISFGLILAGSFPLAVASFDFFSIASEKTKNTGIAKFSSQIEKTHDFLNHTLDNGTKNHDLFDSLIKSFSSNNKEDYITITGKNEGKYTTETNSLTPINSFVSLFTKLFSNISIPSDFATPMKAIEQIWWGTEEHPIGISDAIHNAQISIAQMNGYDYDVSNDTISQQKNNQRTDHSTLISKIFSNVQLLDLVASIIEGAKMSIGSINPNFIIAYVYLVLLATGKLQSTKNLTVSGESQWNTLIKSYQDMKILKIKKNALLGEMEITLYDLFCIFNPLTDINFLTSGDSAFSQINMQTLLEKKNYGYFVPKVGSLIWELSILNDQNKLFLFDNQSVFNSNGHKIETHPLLKFSQEKISLGLSSIEGIEIDVPDEIQLNLQIGSKNENEPLIDLSLDTSKEQKLEQINKQDKLCKLVNNKTNKKSFVRNDNSSKTFNIVVPMIFLNKGDQEKISEKADIMSVTFENGSPISPIVGIVNEELISGKETELTATLPFNFSYNENEWKITCDSFNTNDDGINLEVTKKDGTSESNSVSFVLKFEQTGTNAFGTSSPIKPKRSICGTYVINIEYSASDCIYKTSVVNPINIVSANIISPQTTCESCENVSDGLPLIGFTSQNLDALKNIDSSSMKKMQIVQDGDSTTYTPYWLLNTNEVNTNPIPFSNKKPIISGKDVTDTNITMIENNYFQLDEDSKTVIVKETPNWTSESKNGMYWINIAYTGTEGNLKNTHNDYFGLYGDFSKDTTLYIPEIYEKTNEENWTKIELLNLTKDIAIPEKTYKVIIKKQTQTGQSMNLMDLRTSEDEENVNVSDFNNSSLPEGISITKDSNDNNWYLSGTPTDEEKGTYKIIPSISEISNDTGTIFPFIITDIENIKITGIDKIFTYLGDNSSKEEEIKFYLGNAQIFPEITNISSSNLENVTFEKNESVYKMKFNVQEMTKKLLSKINKQNILKDTQDDKQERGSFTIDVKYKNDNNGVLYIGSITQEYIIYKDENEYKKHQEYEAPLFFNSDKSFIKLENREEGNNIRDIIGMAFSNLFEPNDSNKSTYAELAGILVDLLFFNFI